MSNPGATIRIAVRSSLAVMVVAAMAACSVGPDFHPPQAPSASRYTTTPLPSETVSAEAVGGLSQRIRSGSEVPADWSALFQCDALDALVRRALSDSPALAQVRARLVRAQQDLAARRGASQIPAIDAGLSANRIDIGGGSFENAPQLPVSVFPLTLYTASVRVSYTLDLFGKSRRELEALQAAVDYERFELLAARLMLAGNVVTTAIETASLLEQIDATNGLIDLDSQALQIVGRLEQIGGVPKLDAVEQSGELARTRAALPALTERLEQSRHRLAVLTGQLPGDAALPDIRLADLVLPTELPLTVPSELVRQRPDIQAAEALLHEASARVGVATANLYPRITLSGTAGSLTTVVGSLLSSGTGFALLGASLAQPLFHGGELKAQKRSAVAAYEQAGGAYREVVLQGFQNVADTLCALDGDAKALHERADAAQFAKSAYEITSKRYDAGGVSQLALLRAQRQVVAASLEEIGAAADRFADSAALFQALGGGWWTRNADATVAEGGKPKSAP